MNLTFDQIASLAAGIVRYHVTDIGLELHRFTEWQADQFDHPMRYFADKPFFVGCFKRNCRTCAGVTLDFVTDAVSFGLSVGKNEHTNDSAAQTFDLYVNGRYRASYDADQGFSVRLGRGEKRITVYFPYFNFPVLSGMTLNDGASFSPAGGGVDLLCIGDSITHGVSAVRPSGTWSMIVSRKCGIRVLNQANSGYVYDASVMERVCDPRLIALAYGTNDCCNKSEKELEDETRECILRIMELYPGVPILGILPPWSCHETLGPMIDGKRPVLERVYRELGLAIADGSRLIPQNARYFHEDGVHPNDAGFSYYGSRMASLIRREKLI